MTEINNENYIRFKKLLGYFVAHLEWVVNEDEDSIEYKKYIRPLIEGGRFKITGQGYADGQIQQQVNTWDQYTYGQICINIQPNFGDYKSSKCYLNWRGTGLNILAVWDGDKVTALRQEEYHFWEENPSRKDLGMQKGLDELQLFDEQDLPGEELTEFYKDFEQAILLYKEKEQERIQMKETKPYIDLLHYKKQIILQGPPGTGKTRLAKEIAQALTGTNTARQLTKEAIIDLCAQQVTIPTAKTNLTFKILGINGTGVRVENSEGNEHTAPFNEILKMFADETWKKEGVIVNGTQSYSAAVARFIHSKWDMVPPTEVKEYCKIIQFHPSYSYEDFVRGITAKTNTDGEGIIYEAENKVLAQFATAALDNYNNAQLVATAGMPVEEQAKSNLDRFINHVIDAIDKNDKYPISDNVYIFYVDDKRFKYKGDNWEAHPNGLNMNFSELEKIIAARISERADIVQEQTLNALTRSHATYYANVLEQYHAFLAAQTVQPVAAPVPLKNYVLIIDEINRANLSAVLGELIYALEYRGKEVDTLYAINGNNKMVLPPNLYIIGTMNTADRSVGHIDYAIRRRFAFVDVPPQELQEDAVIYFNKEGYHAVARLFEQNVSSEFEAKDVQIGHSYFIAKKEDTTDDNKKQEIFRLKMDYEVVPILNEYVKDGVLVGEIDGQHIKKYIEALKSDAS